MDKSAHAAVTRRLLTGTRIVFIAAAVGALIAGYLGLKAFIQGLEPGLYGLQQSDILYYDLQLFVLGSDPLQTPGPYPWTLELARFGAPAATVYAVYEAARALFAGEFRRWRNRVRRGHAIVVGDTTVARALADELAMGRGGVARQVHTVVDFSPEALRAAGIAGAAVVYACADDTEDSTLNVAIAQVAATARRKRFRRPPLKVYAQVSSATLALGLRARWLGQPPREKLAVDFFNVDELAARASVRPGDFQIPADREPHIMLAGLGTFGRALLEAYAQHWLLESGRPGQRVRVSVVGATEAEVDELLAQWQGVRDVCSVRAVEGSLDAALNTLDGVLPHRTYICYTDENEALFAALTTARLWRGGRDSVVVRLNRLARHDAFSVSNPRLAARSQPGSRPRSSGSRPRSQGSRPRSSGSRSSSGSVAATDVRLNLLDDVEGRLRLISVTAEACKPKVIALDLVERLAQAIHHQYLVTQVKKGEVNRASLTSWENLSEELREANRAPARDIGQKLSKIHATVAPRTGFNDPFAFTPAEEDELARHEHDRWWAQRRATGWQYGPVRNTEKRLHPSMVDWTQLTLEEQAKDREAVLDLPRVLAEVGLEIVRLSDRAAPVPVPRADLSEQSRTAGDG